METLVTTIYEAALKERYEILGALGHGSFGVVCKARRIADDAIVALKIPKDQELGEAQLRREPDLIRAFDHPHIVRVYGSHTINGYYVIEMEYIAGHNLAEILDGVNREQPLSYQRILTWVQQLLQGLQMLHTAQVVHGDIKPQNVLIDQDGHAKLVDFGTSRRLEDVWVWTRGHGTEAYMAPEVFFDSQRFLAGSDIYSVGVMLYEMVTGELPYQSPIQLTTERAIKRPREINANLSPELESIILRAMERDPAVRYPTAAAMLTDIETLLAKIHTGDVATPPDRTRAARMPFRPDSSSPLYYLEQAKACLAAEDMQNALAAAQKAVERSAGHPTYLRLLAGIYRRLGYTTKALETYAQVLTAYQQSFPASEGQLRDVLERLGELYIKASRYREAVQIYRRLLNMTPPTVYTKFQLAIALGLDADYKQAIRLLEEVRAARPDAVVVYSKLGWAYMLDGNPRQACSYFNQALVMDPSDLRSLYELGKYAWIIGKREQARGYFERLQRYDLTGAYAGSVKDLLNTR